MKKYTDEYQDFVQMLKHKLSEEASEGSMPMEDDEPHQMKFLEDTTEEMEMKDLASASDDGEAEQRKQIRERS